MARSAKPAADAAKPRKRVAMDARLNVQLPTALRDQMLDKAERLGQSINEAARDAIRDWVAKR